MRPPSLNELATWTAAALALGWLGVAVAGVVMPDGHPPAAFVVGEGVVMVSYLIAPVGIAAASLELWRTKHRGGKAPARTVAPLAVNAVFLLVAVVLGWLLLEAIKR